MHVFHLTPGSLQQQALLCFVDPLSSSLILIDTEVHTLIIKQPLVLFFGYKHIII